MRTAAVENGLVLRWCFNCNFYEWSKHTDGRFVCRRCNQPIRDWVMKLLFDPDAEGKGYTVPGIGYDLARVIERHAEPAIR